MCYLKIDGICMIFEQNYFDPNILLQNFTVLLRRIACNMKHILDNLNIISYNNIWDTFMS